jgi:predicted nucleic acid-binding protein
MPRFPGVTYAVCNTGPLLSAFQSDSFALLTRIFAEIHISEGCAVEIIEHGWGEEVQAALPDLIIVELTAEEKQRALAIAQLVAAHPDAASPDAEDHLGEAQAIVLALRPDYQDDLLLLDESAARAVAREMGARLSGFPGALLLGVQGGLISAEELSARLEECRRQGTHYGPAFIRQVYEMARSGRK